MPACRRSSVTAPSRVVPSCAAWSAGLCGLLALGGCLNPLPEEVPSNQAPGNAGPPSPVLVPPTNEPSPDQPVDSPPAASQPGEEPETPRDCTPDAGASTSCGGPEQPGAPRDGTPDAGASTSCGGPEQPVCSRCDASPDAEP
jgi:hypothetical protein